MPVRIIHHATLPVRTYVVRLRSIRDILMVLDKQACCQWRPRACMRGLDRWLACARDDVHAFFHLFLLEYTICRST